MVGGGGGGVEGVEEGRTKKHEACWYDSLS